MSLKMLVNLLVKSIIRNLVFLGIGELKDGNDSYLFVFVHHLHCTFHTLNVENVKECRHSK